MTYLSLFSGIEAATVAWHGLMEPVAFAEVEPFASAVLAHHYPDVPNLGDVTKFKEWKLGAVDVLVGGSPCQSFSVAGLRKGLADPRGNLMLVYLAIARELAPRWIVWENVPGVLSSDGGRAFGTFLGGMAECGYGFAYRVLDARYFGVPQRRRRVFVVGYLGDWRPAAAVLFEPHSLSGNPPPRREAGARVTATVAASPPSRRNGGSAPVSGHMVAHSLRAQMNASHREDSDTYVAHALTAQHTASGRMDPNGETFVAGTVCANGKAAGSATQQDAETNVLVVPFDTTQITSAGNYSNPQPGDPMHPLAKGQHPPAIAGAASVRRLMVVECERLMGLPDDYTLIPYRGKPAKDGPRYRALGNSMAVPVMAHIGRRLVDIAAILTGGGKR